MIQSHLRMPTFEYPPVFIADDVIITIVTDSESSIRFHIQYNILYSSWLNHFAHGI